MAGKREDRLLVLWRARWIAWAKEHQGAEIELSSSIGSWCDSRLEGGTRWEILTRQIKRRAEKEGIRPAKFVRQLFSRENPREVMSYFRGD